VRGSTGLFLGPRRMPRGKYLTHSFINLIFVIILQLTLYGSFVMYSISFKYEASSNSYLSFTFSENPLLLIIKMGHAISDSNAGLAVADGYLCYIMINLFYRCLCRQLN
jgi:hypothetical protein